MSHALSRHHRETISLDGTDVDVITLEDAAKVVVDRAQHGIGGIVVTPNIDHLRQLRQGGALSAAYKHADLVVADGQPLVWFSRLQRTPLPERVAGADLFWTVSKRAARHGTPIYLLGGGDGSAPLAASKLRNTYLGLHVCGYSSPRVPQEPDAELLDELADRIRRSRARIVFVGLGAPKQEVLSAGLKQRLPHVWLLNVGAAIDMAAAKAKRAPIVFQRAGLEWIWRLAQEPIRLFKRYVIEGIPYACALLVRTIVRRYKHRPQLSH